MFANYITLLKPFALAFAPSPVEAETYPTDRLDIGLAVSMPLAITPPSHAWVVDSSDMHRPAYRGLLVYSWLRQIAHVHSDLLENLKGWAALLHNSISTARQSMNAVDGSAITGTIWSALALRVAGEHFDDPGWIARSEATFNELLDSQQKTGPFLQAIASDNPEAWWYDELVLLHAMASYASITNDPRSWSAVARAAEFHCNETQPDHATTQPWGLLAFIWHAPARSLADQMIHTLATQNRSNHQDLVTHLLIQDVLCGLDGLA